MFFFVFLLFNYKYFKLLYVLWNSTNTLIIWVKLVEKKLHDRRRMAVILKINIAFSISIIWKINLKVLFIILVGLITIIILNKTLMKQTNIETQ